MAKYQPAYPPTSVAFTPHELRIFRSDLREMADGSQLNTISERPVGGRIPETLRQQGALPRRRFRVTLA
jgi:hypothetical protein